MILNKCTRVILRNYRGQPPQAAECLKTPDFPYVDKIWIPNSCIRVMERRDDGTWNVEVDDHFWLTKKWPQIMKETQGLSIGYFTTAAFADLELRTRVAAQAQWPAWMGPTPRQNSPWTKDEERELQEAFAMKHLEIKDIAERHGRGESSIISRLMKLGLMQAGDIQVGMFDEPISSGTKTGRWSGTHENQANVPREIEMLKKTVYSMRNKLQKRGII